MIIFPDLAESYFVWNYGWLVVLDILIGLGPTGFARLLDLFSNDEWRDELRNFAPFATYKSLCVQPLMTAGLRNVPFPT